MNSSNSQVNISLKGVALAANGKVNLKKYRWELGRLEIIHATVNIICLKDKEKECN